MESGAQAAAGAAGRHAEDVEIGLQELAAGASHGQRGGEPAVAPEAAGVESGARPPPTTSRDQGRLPPPPLSTDSQLFGQRDRLASSTSSLFSGEDRHGLRRFTIRDLQSSWTLFFVRLFHAWSFLLATVVVTGIGIHTFLNLFLAFFRSTTGDGQVLNVWDDWHRTLVTCITGVLYVLLFAGLIERALWLLMDCFSDDMFIDYRRTLCCEGSGPGNFPKRREVVKLTNEESRRSLLEALGDDYVLHHNFFPPPAVASVSPDTFQGQGTSEASAALMTSQSGIIGRSAPPCPQKWVPAGAQLLAAEALQDLASQHEPGTGEVAPQQDVRERLETLPLPAKLAFRVDLRHASLDASRRSLAFWLAIWDLVIQFAIALSILGWPILRAAHGKMLNIPTFLVSLRDQFVDGAVDAATFHICAYFLWSTLMDYWSKMSTLYKRSMLRWARHRLSGGGSRRRRGGSASSEAVMLRGRRMTPRVAALWEAIGEDQENVLGPRKFLPGQADNLNAHVWIRNALALPGSQIGIAVLASLACIMVMCTDGTYFIKLTSFALICFTISCRFFWAARSRQATLHLQQQALSGATHGQFALWFQFNCSIEPLKVRFKSVMVFFCGVGLLLAGLIFDKSVLAAVGMLLACWSAFMFWATFSYFSSLWKFVLAQCATFAVVAIVSLTCEYGWEGFVQATTIILLTQLGLTRRSVQKSKIIVFGFFTIVFVVIATATFLTAASTTGMNRKVKSFSWKCVSDDPSCVEFAFPLRGSRTPYGFCSMSWPMGYDKHGTSDTVSDRCGDTRLSLIDFGEMAGMAYHLPNVSATNVVLNKFFPGWKLVYWQAFNTGKDKQTYTTFLHLRRGKTSVIAVRGTYSAAEVLQDLNYYMPAAFLNLASLLGPSVFDSTGLLLEMQHRNIVLWGLGKIGPETTERDQFRDLLEYVRGQQSELHGEQIYITGHSLGGGLAQVVASLLNLTSVTFSAPGATATSSILSPSPTVSSLRHHNVNVVPDGDVVPWVDKQAGSSLQIDCAMDEPLDCHALASTMCELLAACGDGGGRDHARGFNRSCEVCRASGQADDIGVCQTGRPQRNLEI
eukprot:TRINITY_DN24351_c0_g3_i1.p1 TRINITY_DN24351_c0_g3~~TRINITY_DN24351_c0_g3_i1.p1  ORF type:complete len:1096 (-),score=153.83 TRINITY_DN24351_c0_g3_i1:175-3420(-)